jgi:L-threonylcarbamoyladenylate synthase
MSEEIQNDYEVIKNGGIILYPTDTVWGIGCDASNEEAVAKIYALKKREDSKSMIVLMNGDKMMYNVFSAIPDLAWEIWELSNPSDTELEKRNPKQRDFIHHSGCD